jgi:hypothetical protein
MIVERRGPSSFTIGVSAVELSTIVAALRLAADVLSESAETPREAVAGIEQVLADYEHATARLLEQED